MPKHAFTFKHLIATSSKRDDAPRRERSVNERLAASRLDSLSSALGGVTLGGGPSRSGRSSNAGAWGRSGPGAGAGTGAGGIDGADAGAGARQVPPHLASVYAGRGGAGGTGSLGTARLDGTAHAQAPRNTYGLGGYDVADEDVDRAWSVSWETSGAGTASALDLDDGSVHPAELLRRSQLALHHASRSVAGPAPPPSWRRMSYAEYLALYPDNAATSSGSKQAGQRSKGKGRDVEKVSMGQLREAGALLGLAEGEYGDIADLRRRGGELEARAVEESCRGGEGGVKGVKGVESLLMVCQRLILRLLHDHTPLSVHPDPTSPPVPTIPSTLPSRDARTSAASSLSAMPHATTLPDASPSPPLTTTLAQATMEQLPYLDPHLRIALLDLSSVLPEGDPSRLTERGIRALLADPPPLDVPVTAVRDDTSLLGMTGGGAGVAGDEGEQRSGAGGASKGLDSISTLGQGEGEQTCSADRDSDDDDYSNDDTRAHAPHDAISSSSSAPFHPLPMIARPEIRHLPLTLSTSNLIIPLLRDIQRSTSPSFSSTNIIRTTPSRPSHPSHPSHSSHHSTSAPLHPSPVPHTYTTVSLTSLNLAYSHIKDLERLVDALPPALRELGLVRVTLGGGVTQGRQRARTDEQDGLRRGLGALGRKMLVLKVLDLSYISPFPTHDTLSALLTPATTRLPSLRLLGLRSPASTLPAPPLPHLNLTSPTPAPAASSTTHTSAPLSTGIARQSSAQRRHAAGIERDEQARIQAQAQEQLLTQAQMQVQEAERRMVRHMLRDPARVRAVEVVWD